LWIIASAGVDVATKYGTMASTTRAAHLGVDDRVDDILKHPAFAGFGRLILSWDDGRNDPNMLLRNIGSLLPYHTHVDPAVVVSSLNRMIDDASSGKTICFDIYTDAETSCLPTPVIQTSPQPNRQRSSPWVMPTGSHRQRPWNGEWRRCGG